MHEPDVDRMMSSISARQYNEWRAYEQATGPLGSEYERELLAQLHELIQINNQLTGASLTKKGKKNPAGKFKSPVRAHEVFKPDDEDEGEEGDDHDEEDDGE